MSGQSTGEINEIQSVLLCVFSKLKKGQKTDSVETERIEYMYLLCQSKFREVWCVLLV